MASEKMVKYFFLIIPFRNRRFYKYLGTFLLRELSASYNLEYRQNEPQLFSNIN